MDLFEYILIMTSVIFAMAVAQLLLGFSRLAQSSVRIRPYLAHSVWALILFVMIFANWWANWEFRSMAWTLPMYAYMLIAPTLFFFACTLLVPQDFEHDEVDLAEHFLRIRQPFLWAFFVASFAIPIDGSLLADEPLWHPGRIGHAAIVFGALWGIGTQNKRTHNAIALCVLSGLVWAMYSRAWNPVG